MQQFDTPSPLNKRTYFMFSSTWLNRISYLYLVLPFIIFCMTWLHFLIGLIGTVLVLFTLWLSWRGFHKTERTLLFSIKQTVPAFILIFTWVALSGVGGYAFQNRDQYWRNAILHDLINYSWPVIYNTAANYNQMLVYYIGYWLPAALAGKVFGWGIANAILFISTFIGVALTTLHLASRGRFSPLFSILLLIFFSGMDMVGVVLIAKTSYPVLIPPIQHLDAWADTLQYSSFTTQLFWVYNQAVPCWLCTIMIINREERSRQFLVWALCVFLAPLTAIGLFPLVLI